MSVFGRLLLFSFSRQRHLSIFSFGRDPVSTASCIYVSAHGMWTTLLAWLMAVPSVTCDHSRSHYSGFYVELNTLKVWSCFWDLTIQSLFATKSFVASAVLIGFSFFLFSCGPKVQTVYFAVWESICIFILLRKYFAITEKLGFSWSLAYWKWKFYGAVGELRYFWLS